MALRSMEHRQTGFTPNRLMLGRDTIQPVDLLLGLSDSKLEEYEPYQWVLHLAKQFSEVHKLARDNINQAQLRQKRDYDLRMLENTFNIGDLVYKRDSSTRVGVSSKLRPPWIGPYIVVGCSPPRYRVADRKKEYVLHHDRLKPCNDGHIPLWARRKRHTLLVPNRNLDDTVEAEDLDATLPYVGGVPDLFHGETSERDTLSDSVSHASGHGLPLLRVWILYRLGWGLV